MITDNMKMKQPMDSIGQVHLNKSKVRNAVIGT